MKIGKGQILEISQRILQFFENRGGKSETEGKKASWSQGGWTPLFIHTYMHACIYTNIHTQTYMHTNMYMHAHEHVYMHSYLDTHILTNIHTYIRICIMHASKHSCILVDI